MADEPIAQQLVTLRRLLDEFDGRLARAPVAPVGLEDLKSTVDTLRTNMWAILSAGHGAFAPGPVGSTPNTSSSSSLRGSSPNRSASWRSLEGLPNKLMQLAGASGLKET
jgi:hypothetical protein